MFHLSCSSLNLTTFHDKVLFHFSSLNWGKIWWCLFQEHTCFALMHFSGKRNIEQIVSAPATPELLTQQDWSILLLWLAMHQQNPQCCCAHLRLSLRLVPFRFCILLHFLQHRSINLCLLPGSEQRDTFAEMKWNGGDVLCRWHAAHTLTELSLPELALLCGTFLSWGWLGEQAEVRRAQGAGALQASSLRGQELLIPAVPTKPSTTSSAKSQEGYNQSCGCPNPLLPLPLSSKIELRLSGAGVLLSPVYFLEFLSIYILEANPYQFLSTIPGFRLKLRDAFRGFFSESVAIF